MREELQQVIELIKEIRADLKDLKDQINKESQSYKLRLETKELKNKISG